MAWQYFTNLFLRLIKLCKICENKATQNISRYTVIFLELKHFVLSSKHLMKTETIISIWDGTTGQCSHFCPPYKKSCMNPSTQKKQLTEYLATLARLAWSITTRHKSYFYSHDYFSRGMKRPTKNSISDTY